MKSLILLALCLVGFMLVGCGESDLGTTNPAPPKVDDQIANIEKNTHMPQAAKDAAIGQIKAREEAGKKMAEEAKKGHLSAQ